MFEEIQLELRTHIDVIEEYVPLRNRFLVDVGCGDGTLCRQLAKRGALVLGVEPDQIQAEKNRKAEIVPNVGLAEGSAQELPLESQQTDAVLFQYSFHHVPADSMHKAIEEAIRVLKPDGILYFAEPVARGLHHDTIAHFHDESTVQRDAEQHIRKFARPRFSREKIVSYTTERMFDSFDQFAELYGNLSYNQGYSIDQVRSDKVRESFEKSKEGDRYRFTTPVRVNCFSGLIPN